MIKLKRQKAINSTFFLVLALSSTYLIFKNRHSTNTLLYTMLGVASIYLTWALIFHKIDKSLTLPIILEYLLTAVLVLILLMGVLY